MDRSQQNIGRKRPIFQSHLLAEVEQRSEVSKLKIEDWKRKLPEYETSFMGEQYHLVKDGFGYRVESNNLG